ncbi:hypothetical protein BDF20DRAFT_910004 [Mycotypha africana]|uniref:uncharacterized protein n=1 Tax=Mycotypha africana TaxID=64632 RepID=UPI002300AEF4|nr:uncharacterized protein BDF20DRAFT_910004 [Mycotypha africana]KAI8987373.1 hypothetical protein BDF20DRAFT_910004 [Mycotypha africana]
MISTTTATADNEKQEHISTAYDDLPTLDQVLHRKTLPPVCLYNFYIVMRDRLKQEELLDFYLDLQHHELLWNKYIKQLYKTGFLTETDLSDGYQSPRILSRLSEYSTPQRLQTPSPIPQNASSVRTISSTATDFIFHNLSKQDVTESAQRLLLRYLVPSATKDITAFLPNDLVQRLRHELEREEELLPHTASSASSPSPATVQPRRDDPLLFQEAKQYVFNHLQTYCYPKFLRLKVWGNITLHQQLGRLVIGLLCLLAALTTSLSFIFLGYAQWGKRFWLLLPYWFGIYNLLVFLTGLDPIWVLVFNKSETTTFKFNTIKQPQVKRILIPRSIWLLFVITIISITCTILFCAIPSRRL